ncbi:MAG TPA: GNAT family N-acetyltransferase [Acidimicrobiales bacterium]|nr:GNAT family N-acetyltransferase [Acidimicrobiales bacterium]
MSVEIRPVAPSEVDEAGEVTVASYRTLGGLVLTEGYSADLRDVAARTVGATVLVAVEHGRVLGCVTFVDDPSSPWSEGLVAGEIGVRMLAVAPEARTRGIGTALLAACLERARAAGATRAVLHSTASMTVAHRIYERAGFRRVPERDVVISPELQIMAFTLELG